MTNKQDAKPDFHLPLGGAEVPSAASTSQTVDGSGAVSTLQEPPLSGPVARAEWTRRYAARLMEAGGVEEIPAIQMAEAAAENFNYNGDEWLDPEDDADVEMSYWENDGDDE
jgi:hypothetical protein